MGWIHLHGKLWQVTGDEARLRVRLAAPDAGCPRQSWNWDLFQIVKVENPAPGQRKSEGFIQVEISDLYFQDRDWRRLSGLEIRADAAWHDAREYVDEYGRLHPSQVIVSATHFGQPKAAGRKKGGNGRDWIAHDFILRFGTLDGWCLPCELDAWLIPRDDYYRQVPETPEAVARFAEGPPNLRVMTRTIFKGGTVEVPRCPDPVPGARRLLSEATGCENFHQPKVEWTLRQLPGEAKASRMPGWRSTVSFSTRPEE